MTANARNNNDAKGTKSVIMFSTQEQPDPTQEADEGKFIPEHLLLEWYRKMQREFPQVFTPEDELFASDQGGQHPYGTKLLTYVDDDPNKPMHCEVRGSKWKSPEPEHAGTWEERRDEPVYVVFMNGTMTQIPLISAHYKKGGWKVVIEMQSMPFRNISKVSMSDHSCAATTSHRNSQEPANDTQDLAREQQEKKTCPEPVVPRECIECDASNCHARSHQYKCSRCQLVYYCSKKCQTSHWKVHKPRCKPLQLMRDALAPPKEEDIPNVDIPPYEKYNVECGICLQNASNANPVILPTCDHVFCYLCLKKWKNQAVRLNPSHEDVRCPYCRAEIPSDVQGIDDLYREQARRLLAKAQIKPEGSQEQRNLYNEALDIMDKLLEKHPNCIRDIFQKAEILLVGEINAKLTIELMEKVMNLDLEVREKLQKQEDLLEQMHVAKLSGNHDQAADLLHAVEKIRNDMGENSIGSSVDGFFEAPLMLATAYQQDQQWENAIGIYDAISLRAVEATSGQQREIVVGICRCLYELGIYQGAIDAGMTDINVYRHLHGVYKYVALSQKAIGNLDAAIETINRAVLYESPWNDRNKKEMMDLYLELVALKNNSSSAGGGS